MINQVTLNKLRENSPTIKKLYLFSESLTCEDIRLLADAIKNNTYLTELGLNNNKFKDDGLRALSDALPFSVITFLDLSANSFTNKGLIYFFQKLNTTSIRNLNLQFNKIDSIGIEALAKALTNNTRLIQLNINHNEFNDTSAISLIQSLNSNYLQQLFMAKNNLTDSFGNELANLLKNDTSLVLIDVSYNQLTDQSVSQMAIALRANSHLTTLLLKKNKIENITLNELIYTCKFNTTLKDVDLTHNALHGNIEAYFLQHENKKFNFQERFRTSKQTSKFIPISLVQTDHIHFEFLKCVFSLLKMSRVIMNTSDNYPADSILALPREIKKNILKYVFMYCLLTEKQKENIIHHVVDNPYPLKTYDKKEKFLQVVDCRMTLKSVSTIFFHHHDVSSKNIPLNDKEKYAGFKK